MPGPRRSGIFELRHHIFENLVQQVAKLERIEGKRFIRLLRFAPCKSMHPVPDGERVQGQTHSVAKQ